MAYTIETAKILSENLRRFVTLNPHQLAGHMANLDFWLSEVRHRVDAIDQYGNRFRAMKAGQLRYTQDKQTVQFRLEDPQDLYQPSQPTAIPEPQLKEARRDVIDAAYRFLLRCHATGFLDEAGLRKTAESIGTSVEPRDIAK